MENSNVDQIERLAQRVAYYSKMPSRTKIQKWQSECSAIAEQHLVDFATTKAIKSSYAFTNAVRTGLQAIRDEIRYFSGVDVQDKEQ